jgi:adenylylsulfate kinase
LVIWLIGMSGAGKTSIGTEVYRLLKAKRPNVVLLDGGDFRKAMANDLGHSVADRRTNGRRLSQLCRFLSGQGIDVACPTIGAFSDIRDWNRKHIEGYFEAYVEVPLDVLIARDRKDFYRPALAGEASDVVGVDISFEPPVDPDLVIDNSQPTDTFEPQARKVLEQIDAKSG